jgi:hypothetical protein
MGWELSSGSPGRCAAKQKRRVNKMRENATGDRDPQARTVWKNHLREKKTKRQTTIGHQHCKPRALPEVTREQARARTYMAELELSLL